MFSDILIDFRVIRAWVFVVKGNRIVQKDIRLRLLSGVKHNINCILFKVIVAVGKENELSFAHGKPPVSGG